MEPKPKLSYAQVQAITAMRRAAAAATTKHERLEVMAAAVVEATRGYIDAHRRPLIAHLDRHGLEIAELKARLAQLESIRGGPTAASTRTTT